MVKIVVLVMWIVGTTGSGVEGFMFNSDNVSTIGIHCCVDGYSVLGHSSDRKCFSIFKGSKEDSMDYYCYLKRSLRSSAMCVTRESEYTTGENDIIKEPC